MIIHRNQRGELHRLNGPAIIDVDGHQEWYENGVRHRLTGPAVIRPDGTELWCVNGRNLTPAEIIMLKLMIHKQR